jgi:hypothetical protein
MKIVVLTLAFVIASTTANAQTASTSAQRWHALAGIVADSAQKETGWDVRSGNLVAARTVRSTDGAAGGSAATVRVVTPIRAVAMMERTVSSARRGGRRPARTPARCLESYADPPQSAYCWPRSAGAAPALDTVQLLDAGHHRPFGVCKVVPKGS